VENKSEFSRCIYLVTTTYMAGARESAGSRWMKGRIWVVTHESMPRIQPCLRTDRNAGKETLVAFPSPPVVEMTWRESLPNDSPQHGLGAFSQDIDRIGPERWNKIIIITTVPERFVPTHHRSR